MSKKSKVIIGILGTLVIIGLAVALFLRHLLTESFPETTGITRLDGLHGDVRIYRDDLGVPHIFADTEEDLMFSVGYVHAQDRLWQMELSRRAGQGRLSEAFGSLTLNFDRMFRTIGFKRLAGRLEKSLPSETRSLLSAYAKGVNAFIDNHRTKLPVEFDILGISPEPWTIEHSLMIVRLQAWELNLSWWIDLTLGDLVNKLGETKTKEIFPSYPKSAPTILPSSSGKRPSHASTGMREVDRAYRRFFGIDGRGFGSNSWAVSGEKSATGRPLLANDPHLTMPAPSRWYMIHMSGGGFEVAGVSIPGVPGIVIGRNRHIAWGLTNGMIDDADFYIEKIDSLNPSQYYYDRRLLRMSVWDEDIFVRGQGPDTLRIRETHRGPIISSIHSYPLFEYIVYKTDLEKNFPLSLQWTGYEMSDEAGALFKVNKASNWRDFEEGLRGFTVPAQNFIYADDEGNVGFHLAGRVPIRRKQNSLVPSPGWTSEHDWQGFIPFEKLPKEFNPTKSYVATANNKIVDETYPYYLSDLWEPPSRIMRIEELLKEKNKATVEDFQVMQSDVVSPHAREIVPFIIRAFEGESLPEGEVRTALAYLRNWDYALRKDDVASSIFNMFFMKLLDNTYRDEMGDELFNNYLLLASVPHRVTTSLLHDSTSAWFDGVRTSKRETRDEIIRKSFLDAIAELQRELGGELKTWRWGRLHQATFQHLFGRIPGMSKLFNVGPFETGGSGLTINSGEYNLTRPFKHLVGSSMRQIVDLADSVSLYIIIAPGQSGQPLHRHYDDLAPLWLNGSYHHLTMDREKIEHSGWDMMILRPSQLN